MEGGDIHGESEQSFNKKIILANSYIAQILTIGTPADPKTLISSLKEILQEIKKRDIKLGEEIEEQFKTSIKLRIEKIFKQIPSIKNKDVQNEQISLFLTLSNALSEE
ncbi:MAG: hypothetical protein K9L98_02420 [Candidatus Pacebacteria bacterium]|nr:hypothetical protein [Candidatus Paceibacterota bacterium]MCF7862841.1 hypothetical protein [Candidatus Paceibacterota bacterium]